MEDQEIMIRVAVERGLVEDIAAARNATNRAAGRGDGKRDLRPSAHLDVTGAAGELAFARHYGFPDEAVRVEFRKVDPGWDFEMPGTGLRVDVKSTWGKHRRLIYPAGKWPPAIIPDWFVLAWVVPLGDYFEVTLVGAIQGERFGREAEIEENMPTPALCVPNSALEPLSLRKRHFLEPLSLRKKRFLYGDWAREEEGKILEGGEA